MPAITKKNVQSRSTYIPLRGDHGNKTTLKTILLLLTLTSFCSAQRSIHRPSNQTLPTITTNWLGGKAHYTLRNSHFEEYPIFKVFNTAELDKDLLPTQAIAFRSHPEKSVTGSELSALIEQLLTEVKKRKRHYTHFKILSKKNFNRHKACGLVIVKCKKYPFIVKLFRETPQTFINSHCKGLDNMWFFHMAGGVNRHISGLTRVKNARAVQKRIQEHPYWSTLVETPRKWFWLPKNTPWIEVAGTNIGDKKNVHTLIPGIYAVVADAIDIEKQFSMTTVTNEESQMAMALCNYLEMRQDPHVDNFIVEKGSKKLVIIDTENFATMVGIKKVHAFPNYFAWYRYLAKKCISQWFFRTKDERLLAQQQMNTVALQQLGLT